MEWASGPLKINQPSVQLPLMTSPMILIVFSELVSCCVTFQILGQTSFLKQLGYIWPGRDSSIVHVEV